MSLPLLELKNLRRAFYGLDVLRSVDLAVAAGGITVLLIEHDMGFIAHLCDPVIVMAEGQVLTQGTFDEVRADHRVREAYLGRRAA